MCVTGVNGKPCDFFHFKGKFRKKKQARGTEASKGEEPTQSGNMFKRRPLGLSHAQPVERCSDIGRPLISRMFSHFGEKVSGQRRGERPSGAQPGSG